ncbi:portal protein [Providencia phage Kokobel1]|uniref:Portal protein n=1 Tax=Providencia phage Kokobel1 TaxID=2783540 RepID=A0A873WG31_9CAUD|nr:portal protein [Providencia phage Kokobel1]QPB11460.1 portal protein B [Providencia phage Kokobel1]
MDDSIKSLVARSAGGAPEIQAQGGYEGAQRNTRELYRWNPSVISPDQQLDGGQKELADARVQDVVQNDGFASGAIAIHRDNIVGSQYMLNAKPNLEALGLRGKAAEDWEEEFQAVVESKFNIAADSPENWFDATRRNTLTGLIRLGVAQSLIAGEVLASAEWVRTAGRPFNTAIQLISPHRLSNPNNAMNTANIRGGVHVDAFGRPLGYYIQNSFPGDGLIMGVNQTWRYVPERKPWGRRQVIHVLEQMLPHQNRGISDMVSALKTFRMTKNFQEITLQNAVINASYAAAIESELPPEAAFAQIGAGQRTFGEIVGEMMTNMAAYANSAANMKIDGAKIPHLMPGTKLNLKPMGTPGGIGTDFEESLLRHIAASLNLSYEQFSRDYTKTNYSSARASMGETWKFMQSRKKMIADTLATNIYLLWLEEMVAKDEVPLPAGKTRDWFYEPLVKDALSRCEWIGAARGQIDEKKETEAAIMRIEAGLSTREKEIARFGEDWRDVFKQLDRENKLMSKYKLTFSSDKSNIAADEKTESEKGEEE